MRRYPEQMPVRYCIALALATACTHAQAPHARMAGEVAALGGVTGIVAGALLTSVTPRGRDIVATFSVVSAVGIVTYAVGELTDPAFTGAPPETIAQRNRRWARILTQRASGAAREGDCTRVRRLEIRIRTYDPEIHDFVFLRDPEIVRCLSSP